jgi:hypothetical protein
MRWTWRTSSPRQEEAEKQSTKPYLTWSTNAGRKDNEDMRGSRRGVRGEEEEERLDDYGEGGCSLEAQKATQTGALRHQCARGTKRSTWDVTMSRRRASSTSGGE